MNQESLQAFTQHAEECFPRECCGLLVTTQSGEVYVKCENKAETPDAHFLISPADYLVAEQLGQITAVCHSHPNTSPNPSDADKSACEASGLTWHILSFPGLGLRTFEPCGFKAPLIGRAFVHGVHDCYSLIRDYYKEELGLQLPEFYRDDLWWEKGGDLYEENFASAGFRQVETPQNHDVILMQIKAKVTNHAGVFVDNGNIVHHLYGQLSRKTVYGGYWLKCTRRVLRHESL